MHIWKLKMISKTYISCAATLPVCICRTIKSGISNTEQEGPVKCIKIMAIYWKLIQRPDSGHNG